jgi:hypothetical protein
MKISKSVKLAVGITMLAPVVMYAAGGPILTGAVEMVKAEVMGPIRALLILVEVVTGAYQYSQSKNPAVLIGTAIVAGITAFGPTLIGN